MTQPSHTGRRSPSTVLSTAFLAVLTLVAATFVSAPASASTTLDGGVQPATTAQCAAGRVCLWATTFYGGNFFSTSSTSASNVAVFTVARSTWNNSSKAAYVYSGSGGSGASVCLAPGSKTTSTTLTSGSVKLSTKTTC